MAKEKVTVDNNIPTITVTELLDIDIVSVVNKLKRPYNVVFTDGTVTIPAKELIINRIVWEVFKKVLITNFSKKFNIVNYYVEGLYTSKSVKSMLEDMFKEVVEVYVVEQNDRSVLNHIFYKTLPQVYVDLNELIVVSNIEYVSSLNILDFLEIQFKPKLMEAIEDSNRHKDPEHVTKTYQVLDDIMRHDPSIADNHLRLGYITKNFRIPQLQQMLGSIGFSSEINNNIFTYPVTSSYVLGLNTNYEVGVTSRDAIKACNALGNEIKTSEYISRTLQMGTSNFMNVVDGDCGSTNYLDYYVSEDGSRLKEIVGKFRLDEETGKIVLVRETDTHLLGKYIKLRHINGCLHTSPRHCCIKCYGTGAVNYPYISRVGHAAAAEAMRGNSQGTISTKHNVGTSRFLDYTLSAPMTKIFRVFPKKNDKHMENTRVGFLESYIDKKLHYTLNIDKNSLLGFKDLMSIKNIRDVNPSSISAISDFYITITNPKDGSVTYEDVMIGMNVSSKHSKKLRILRGFFTTDFLEFLRNDGGEKRFRMEDNGRYVIDINGWNFKEPIFEFKLVQHSSSNFSKDIKEIISSLDAMNGEDYTAILSSFSNLLYDNFKIPLYISEVMACSFLVKDKDNGDYSCGRGVSNQAANLVTIIKNWSLGATYGFERQLTYIFDHIAFGRNLNNHLLDGILCPQEVYDQADKLEQLYGKHYMWQCEPGDVETANYLDVMLKRQGRSYIG